MQKYNSYSFVDFINDDKFVRFIKYGLGDDKGFWEKWLNSSPANIAEYEDARIYILTAISIHPIIDEASQQLSVWNKIDSEITKIEKYRRKKLYFRNIASVAALVSGIIFSVIWYYNHRVFISTGNGEQTTVSLPDGSSVTLNANSTLAYYQAFKWHDKREVWITGEADFNVKHLNNNPSQIKPAEEFIAHAGDLNVEVLGTHFNIWNRRNKVIVSLISGKVEVSDVTGHNKPLILSPGNAAKAELHTLRELPINQIAFDPLAWAGHKMVLHSVSIADIIQAFKDTYGDNIILDNNSLLSKRIDGTISLQNREATLYMLANLLDASVSQDGNTYYLKSK